VQSTCDDAFAFEQTQIPSWGKAPATTLMLVKQKTKDFSGPQENEKSSQ
jgi:hypothetical protein